MLTKQVSSLRLSRERPCYQLLIVFLTRTEKSVLLEEARTAAEQTVADAAEDGVEAKRGTWTYTVETVVE